MVQTCSGRNVSEAEHFRKGEAARAMPCQALDHASGYLLAAGVCAGALQESYRRWYLRSWCICGRDDEISQVLGTVYRERGVSLS